MVNELPRQILNLTIGGIIGVVTVSVVSTLGGDWFAFDLVDIIVLFIAILVLLQFANVLIWKSSRFGEGFN